MLFKHNIILVLLFILAGLCCTKQTNDIEPEEVEASSDVEQPDTQSEKATCCACLPCCRQKNQEEQLEMTETIHQEPVQNQPTEQTGNFNQKTGKK